MRKTSAFPPAIPILASSSFYDDYDQEAYQEECGIWDSEEGRYIMYKEDYNEWFKSKAQIRPYAVDSGEVAAFQLELTLNEVGKAYLSLERYLLNGIVNSPTDGEIGYGYGVGLKSLARRYGYPGE